MINPFNIKPGNYILILNNIPLHIIVIDSGWIDEEQYISPWVLYYYSYNYDSKPNLQKMNRFYFAWFANKIK